MGSGFFFISATFSIGEKLSTSACLFTVRGGGNDLSINSIDTKLKYFL